MADREGALSMLAHYTGNYMLRARGSLNRGELELADKQRAELLAKLRTLGEVPEVVSCIGYLGKTTWKSREDVNAFNEFYTKANPRAKQHKELIKQLFGHD